MKSAESDMKLFSGNLDRLLYDSRNLYPPEKFPMLSEVVIHLSSV